MMKGALLTWKVALSLECPVGPGNRIHDIRDSIQKKPSAVEVAGL